MKAQLRSVAGALAAAMALMAPALSMAATVSVEYSLATLGSPGRYEYRYTIRNLSLATPFSGFSIDFDPSQYDETSLAITSTGTGGWSEQLLGSISVLGIPAQFDAQKTSGLPLDIGDFATGFSIAFTWLGTGTPGSQGFIVYDATTFNTLDSGFTSLAAAPPDNGLPEPSTAGLVGIAIAGLALRQRSRKAELVPANA